MELKEKILAFIADYDGISLDQLFEEVYPIDIALVCEEMTDEELLSFLEVIRIEQIASIVEESEEDFQVRILSFLGLDQVVAMFRHMSADDVADLVGELPLDARKNLFKRMKTSDSQEIQLLLGYGPETAGGIMTTEYLALKSNLTLRAALNKIKDIGPKTEVIETLFVTNDRRQLIGIADLRDILSEPENSTLADIMDTNVLSVQPETDQEEVSLLVSKYDLQVLPVVNKKNVIIGIITVDDIIDVIIEEQTEDFLMVSGVSKDEHSDSDLKTSVKLRLPWLFVNLVTAFIASSVVGMFESVIAQAAVLAAAMPIVAGMGGNSGSQTLSVVVRGIALGELSLKDDWKLVFKEIMLGVVNGLSIGITAGIVLFLRYGNIYLGAIIVVAMTCNLIIAGTFGFVVPLFLKKMNQDPALSSAIFVTTATDVFGFLIFLGMASIILPRLIR